MTINGHLQPVCGTPCVGVEAVGAAVKIAVIDAGAAHFPWTEDLHCLRSERSFQRFWIQRFCNDDCYDLPPIYDSPPIVGLSAAGNAELKHWLEDRGASVRVIPVTELPLFVEHAGGYEIPRRFCHVHACAQAVAYRVRLHHEITMATDGLTRASEHLHAAVRALQQLAVFTDYPAG